VNRQFNTVLAFIVSTVPALTPRVAAGQETQKQNPRTTDREPPGRDLFVPYVSSPGLPQEKELENVEQVKILAEINRLTVELVKRRSNRYLNQSDTPQLVKKLKELARKLHESE
jgi:hypothetical protein